MEIEAAPAQLAEKLGGSICWWGARSPVCGHAAGGELASPPPGTIADLDSDGDITTAHVSEATQYHSLDRAAMAAHA